MNDFEDSPSYRVEKWRLRIADQESIRAAVTYQMMAIIGDGSTLLDAAAGARYDTLSQRLTLLDTVIEQMWREYDAAAKVLHALEEQDRASLAERRRRHAENVAAKAKAAEVAKAARAKQEQASEDLRSRPGEDDAGGDRQKLSVDHVPWRKWKSEPIDDTMVLEVRPISDTDKPASHVLKEEIDKRAAAIIRWSPWERRRHASRRYEGFGQR